MGIPLWILCKFKLKVSLCFVETCNVKNTEAGSKIYIRIIGNVYGFQSRDYADVCVWVMGLSQREK